MIADQLLNSDVHINALSDESGRKYFNVRVSFSDNDTLTIYRNSMDELLDDLPNILVSAIRARIIKA
jgi:hypothetical protein